MKVIIGTVKEISGKFYAKDEHGDIVELHVGDKISKDMLVFGADGNSPSAHIKIGMMNLEQALELTGLEKQIFDLSLIEDNNLDEFISPNNIDKAIEKTGVYAEDDATDKEKEGSIDDETAAGSEAVVGHLQEDSFLARDNGFVDVQSSLRDAQFNSPDNGVDIDGTPVLLTNTEEDTETPIDNPNNNNPVAADDTATTDEDTAVTISVLGNDTDVDGDSLIVTSATAANGTVTINNDGTITYTPNQDFNGSDTIIYSISDGNGGTDTATVNITVTPVDDATVTA
uniref:Ig-like domain-containing protein n=1 Tax=Sulfurimonas indica TaxID=2508707 RepID=UPI00165F13C9